MARRREERLKQACEKLGVNAHYVVCDICSIQKLDDFVNNCIEVFGNVHDVLVNNAGVYVAKNWENITESDWNCQFDTNAKGSYFATLKFLKLWKDQNIKGNMVFVALDRAYQGDITPYGMTKAAVDNFVKGLVKEAIQYGIRVNGVAPGMTASEINHVDPNSNIRVDFTRRKRLILAGEIAEVVGFLVSDVSKCIVGDVILCDEGEALR